MPGAAVVTALRDAFALPGHEEALLWKNAENSAYRTLASGGDIASFNLSQSGLCCFDLCLFAGFSFGDLTKTAMKDIYRGIVDQQYGSAAPLISGDLKTVAMAAINSNNVAGSDVVARWPLAGELVFFRKAGIGQMAHVAYALDGAGSVVSFGHDVPATAILQNLSQQTLNQNGLMQTVEVKTVAGLWPSFASAVYCAPPKWDP